MMKLRDTTNGALRQARRAVVFVVGITVVLFGAVLFFTPGPAIVVIPIGLAILATEFVWARSILTRFKESVNKWAGFNKSKAKSNPSATGEIEQQASSDETRRASPTE